MKLAPRIRAARSAAAFVCPLVLLVLLMLPSAAAADPITKLEGAAGCVADAGSPLAGGDCSSARGLEDVTDVAVSRDGKHAYAAAFSSNSVAVFDRDGSTGELSQLAGNDGCIASDQAPLAGCASAPGLIGPTAIAISPDGKNVYVTGYELDASTNPPKIRGTLVSFARDASTGALTELPSAPLTDSGCFYGGAPPLPTEAVAGCTNARFIPQAPTREVPLGTALDVEVSPDGKDVITASFIPSAVIDWTRDSATGVLTPKECLGSTRTLLPTAGDPASNPDTVCDDSTAPLVDTGSAAEGLSYPTDIEFSPDGSRVYAAALGLEQPPSAATDGTDLPGSVARFDRDTAGPTSGDLTQPAAPAGCVGDSRDPAPGCTNDRTGLLNPYRVAVSPDGADVYVASLNLFPPSGTSGPGPGELALLDSNLAQLDPPCLQQLGLPAGGLDPSPDCELSVLGLVLPTDIGFSPDGSSAFVTSLFHAVASFDRTPSNGKLVQDAPPPQGCSIDPRNLSGGTEVLAAVCQKTEPLNAPTSIEVSPDGNNAYVTSGGFLTGEPNFGPALAGAGITTDDAITVFGPSPPPEPPSTPPPGPTGPPAVAPTCHGVPATVIAATGDRRVRGSGGGRRHRWHRREGQDLRRRWLRPDLWRPRRRQGQGRLGSRRHPGRWWFGSGLGGRWPRHGARRRRLRPAAGQRWPRQAQGRPRS